MIRLQQIDKRFGALEVLRQVDLTVAEGSVTALIGASGSGKSTLLRCVNLLEIPDAGKLGIGEVEVDFSRGRPGRDVVQQVRIQTGMVFQNFQLFPHQRVIANVMEGLLTVQKWPYERARERAESLLAKVGMQDKAQAWPSTLSGGQQQRVAIARALVTDPTLVVADEPTGDLDRTTGEEVLGLMDELHRELGKTIVMVTHDPKAAARAQRMVHLEKGVLVDAPEAALPGGR